MKYFTIKELCDSITAKAYGINNHTISATVADNLIRLVDNVLDPLRTAYGKPINVNSGYRCEKLNRLVKGVTNSDHLLGMAADIDAGSKEENKKLFQLILKLKLPFKQLINEHNYDWVHVSFDRNNIKMETLNL